MDRLVEKSWRGLGMLGTPGSPSRPVCTESSSRKRGPLLWPHHETEIPAFAGMTRWAGRIARTKAFGRHGRAKTRPPNGTSRSHGAIIETAILHVSARSSHGRTHLGGRVF